MARYLGIIRFFSMERFKLIILALSLSAVCCASPPRAEFEITLGVSSAVSPAERDSTLAVLWRRMEKIAGDRFDFTPSGDGKYTLCLHTAFTDRELEYVLTSPGRLEFWELCYWNRDLSDMLPWSGQLREEEETGSNRNFKMLASRIPWRASDSDPCVLERIPVEAYPLVITALDSLKAAGVIPGKVRFGRQTRKDDFGNDLYTVYLLKWNPLLNGPVIDQSFIGKISYAVPSRERYSPELNLVFNEEGAGLWKKVTLENIGKDIAITFDDEILMAPRIFSPIEDGKTTVSAGTEFREAGESLFKCISAIVGSGVLTLPVGCRRMEGELPFETAQWVL